MIGFMKHSMYSYVMSRLETCKGSWPSVAEDTGISKRTIEKIARKEIESPNVHLVQRLNDYFKSTTRKAA